MSLPHPAPASPPLPGPMPNAYWVEPGRFIAGEYPGASTETATRANLGRLMQAGITAFIDLTSPGESGLSPYETLLPEFTSRLGQPPRHQRFPVEDMSTPTEAQVAATLSELEALLASGETIYIHCWGGRGRTGTLAGCYLVQHGLSGEEALLKIQRLRQATLRRSDPSPETSGQIMRVLNWYPR
jgi:hypothetical protein